MKAKPWVYAHLTDDKFGRAVETARQHIPIVKQVVRPEAWSGFTIVEDNGYNVPASWFVGVIDPITGGVEVIALGEDFIWSLRINPDGTADTSEATVGEFDTGLDI